jgi:hypothetical protein
MPQTSILSLLVSIESLHQKTIQSHFVENRNYMLNLCLRNKILRQFFGMFGQLILSVSNNAEQMLVTFWSQCCLRCSIDNTLIETLKQITYNISGLLTKQA